MAWIHALLVVVALAAPGVVATRPQYHGKLIGTLPGLKHEVYATVYAASDDSFSLVNFTYDGLGPDAHFIVGTKDTPDASGLNVPDEKGSWAKLRKYANETIIITLPNNTKINGFKYLAVFCRTAAALFGYITIPTNFETPKQVTVGTLVGQHTKSGPVILVDSMTMLIVHFTYATKVDANFFVGTGPVDISNGTAMLQEKNKSFHPIKAVKNKNITLTLAEGDAWANYDWLAVMSLHPDTVHAYVNFSHFSKAIPLRFTKVDPMPTEGWKALESRGQQKTYLGKKLGDLSAGKHGVFGTLYAGSGKALILEDFSYDGTAPDAFFMVGTSSQPSKDGIVLTNEAGSTARLSAYSSKTIVLKLPSDKVVTDYRWFSVYRKDAEMSLGEVAIPSDFDYPRERSIGSSLSGAHRTHVGEVILKDMKTLFLKDFSYDGSAPDAFFLCGKGRPNPQGTKVPDENGRVAVIHGYSHADLTLTLPGELTMFDIDWFAVYCITYTEIFISVTIPKNPNIPPQMELLQTPKQMELIDGSDFENCETILPNRLQVAWKLESNSILFQLTTKLMAKEWAAFGISGDKDRNQMIGGDVAVVYLEGPSNKVKLEDYYLGSKAQCSITSGGVCPDAKSPLKGTDDLTVMSTKYENGLLSVVYSRPLATTDRFDKTITPAGETTVIAAQGPLAEEPPGVVLYHTMYWTKGKTTLKLNRQAQRNCQPLMSSQAREEPKTETQFGGRDILRREGVTTFTARIGPTGGSRGYAKITGTPGWGIVWWINDELIPVLHVERGKTYTFIAEGGHDDSNSARYHPFYITDSRKGGGSKEDADALGKPGHLLLAGVTLGPDGKPDVSNAVGRYCEWEHKSIDQSNNVKTFEEFKKTLELKCEPNVKSGMFTWTPDEKTPDIVYYQCFTHYYLGWKILVKDPGTPDEPIASKTDTPGDPMTPKHDSACMFGSSLLMTSMLACVTLRLSSQLTRHQ
uniref:Protein to be involved in spindle matrix formation n=1 Tax=Ixodes ricinus TaxID=34613 RepID=A0A147BHR9_IXORI